MPDTSAPLDPLARVDPWAALRDGRMQLLTAIDRLQPADLDLRIAIDGLHLRITEAAALHVAWDRLHQGFLGDVAAGVASARPQPALANLEVLETVEAVTEALDGARRDMLEAAALIAVDRYEERVSAPWDASVVDSVRGYLVAMAMRDGLLAEAIAEARQTS